MSSAFTKGPWFADGPMICGDGTTADVEGFVVATVTRNLIPTNRFTRYIGGIAECEANANLIASAPDLLEACKAALDATIITLDAHSHAEYIRENEGECACRTCIAGRISRAAIARAEGRQS